MRQWDSFPGLGSSPTLLGRELNNAWELTPGEKGPVSQTKPEMEVGTPHRGRHGPIGLMGVTFHLCVSVSSLVNGDTVKTK